MGKSLTVDIGARTASFEEGMRKAADVANRQMGNIGKSIGGLNSQVTSITGSFAKLTGVLAGLGAGVSFTSLIKGSIDAANHIDDLSAQTGIAHKELSGLSYSAKRAGSDLTGAVNSVARLSKNMSLAAAGGKTQAEAFAAIGVSVVDAGGKLRSTNAVLEDLADEFSKCSDGAAKAALAQDIFGKSGMAMIPMLNQGGAALKEQREEALKYGGVTAEFARASTEFNEELGKISLITSGIGTSLSTKLLPVLKGISNAFVWLHENSTKVNAVLVGVSVTMLALALSTGKASSSVSMLGRSFVALLTVIKGSPFILLATAIGAATAALFYFRDTTLKIGETTSSISEILSGAWIKLKETFTSVIGFITTMFTEKTDGWASKIGTTVSSIVKGLYGFSKSFTNGLIALFVSIGRSIGLVAASFVESFKRGFAKIKNLAVSLWDGIKKVFSGDLSFDALSRELSKSAVEVDGLGSQIKDVFSDAFSQDYAGDFKRGIAQMAGGVVESLAIAGKEAKVLKDTLAESAGKSDLAITTPGGGAAAKIKESFDRQIAIARAGYERLYAIVKASAEREQEILAERRELGLIAERRYLEERGRLQIEAVRANLTRLKSIQKDLSAEIERVQSSPAKGQDEITKRNERIAKLKEEQLKLTHEIEMAEAGVADQVRKASHAIEKHNRAMREHVKQIVKDGEAYGASLKKRVGDLQFENTLIGKSASAQAKLRAERELLLQLSEKTLEIEEKIAELRSVADSDSANLITQLGKELSEMQLKTAEAIQEIHASIDVKDWSKAFDDISGSLTDALMRGFESGKGFAKNFKDTLINTFKTMILRPVIESSVKGGMGAMFGGGGAGGGMGSMFGSILSGVGSMFGKGGGFSSMMSSIGGLFGKSATTASTALTTAGTSAANAGTAMASAGSAFSKMVPVIGWIYAGLQSNLDLYKKGWRSENDDKTARLLGGNLPGSSIDVFSKVLGKKWGSILSGGAVISRLWGHKTPELKGVGVQGTLGGGGFSGELYRDMVAKGGLFRKSKKTRDTEEIDKDLQAVLDSTIGRVPERVSQMLGRYGKSFKDVFGKDWAVATKIDLPKNGNVEEMKKKLEEATTESFRQLSVTSVEAVRSGWGKYVEGLKGLSTEEIDIGLEKIMASLDVLKNAKAQLELFGATGLKESDFSAVAKTGEKIFETISRLASTFSATNFASKFVGLKFKGAGLESAGDRQSLVDRAGGAGEFSKLTSEFFDIFASSTDKINASGAALREMFDSVGVSVPNSVAAFRDLLSAQDMSSEAGRALAIKLMQLAPAFNEVFGVIESASMTMAARVDDMRRSIELGGLSQQGQYDYFKREGDAAFIGLQSATTLEDIGKHFETASAALMSSFSLLDEEGKNAKRQSFLTQLEELDKVRQEQMQALKESVAAPAIRIEEAGEAVAKSLFGVAEKIDGGQALQHGADAFDGEVSSIMSEAFAGLSRVAPELDELNARDAAARDASNETLKATTAELRDGMAMLKDVAGEFRAALSNISLDVKVSPMTQEVGSAY